MEEMAILIQEQKKVIQESEEFIKVWTHDTGNLIGIMQGAINLLYIDGELPADQDGAHGMIRYGCQQLLVMNKNINAWKGRSIGTVWKNIELKEWLKPHITAYQFAARSKKIEIALNIGEEVPDIINTDELKLSLVLANLLLNAIKFSTDGKSIAVKVSGNINQVCLSVEDQGIGIPADKLTEIFKPLVRLNKKAKGTGLGLAIVERYVNDLKGTVSVESTVGKGTTFTVKIPFNNLNNTYYEKK